jgi:hypothetical protein
LFGFVIDRVRLIRGVEAKISELKTGRERIIIDIQTMEQAERVEQSVESGYVESIIENIVAWIAVEEDLSESYEKLSKSLPSSEGRQTATQLYMLSTSDADVLHRRLEEFEGFESERRKRIRLVKRLAKIS